MSIMSKLPLPEQDQDVSFSFWVEGETSAKYDVAAFAVEEAILSLTQAEVLLVFSSDEFNSEALLGKKATLQVQLHRHALPRCFSGLVAEAEIRGGEGSSVLHILLLPALCKLENTAGYRIFQELAVPDIVRIILAEHEIHDVSWQLARRYSPRPSCVQYHESDFAFVHRILTEEGIYYYFTHNKEMAGQLVICDRESGFPGCPPEMRLGYAEIAGLHGEARCFSLVRRYRMTGTGHNTGTVPDLYGKASSPYLTAGQSIRVEQHPDQTLNESWRLLRVRHEGVRRVQQVLARHADALSFLYGPPPAAASVFPLKEPGLLGRMVRRSAIISPGSEVVAMQDDVEYVCAFSAVRAGHVFHPQRVVKPLVSGPQKARVVAVDTTRVFLPRCKVLFATGSSNLSRDDATCWVNMATPVDVSPAGQILPAVGEDVFVDFLDGDPDQPVIIARMGTGEVSAPIFPHPHGQDKEHKTSLTDYGKSDIPCETAALEYAVQQEVLHMMSGHDDDRKPLQVMANKGAVSLSVVPGGDKREDVKGVYELNCGEKYLCRTAKLNINASQKVTIRGPGGRVTIDNASITFEAPVIRLKGRLLVEEGETARFEGIRSAIQDELPLAAQCAAAAPAKNSET